MNEYKFNEGDIVEFESKKYIVSIKETDDETTINLELKSISGILEENERLKEEVERLEKKDEYIKRLLDFIDIVNNTDDEVEFTKNMWNVDDVLSLYPELKYLVSRYCTITTVWDGNWYPHKEYIENNKAKFEKIRTENKVSWYRDEVYGIEIPYLKPYTLRPYYKKADEDDVNGK